MLKLAEKEGSKAKKDMDKKKEEEEVVVRMNVDSNDDLCLPAAPQWPGPILTSLGLPPPPPPNSSVKCSIAHTWTVKVTKQIFVCSARQIS